jgi:hypothetical protein
MHGLNLEPAAVRNPAHGIFTARPGWPRDHPQRAQNETFLPSRDKAARTVAIKLPEQSR